MRYRLISIVGQKWENLVLLIVGRNSRKSRTLVHFAGTIYRLVQPIENNMVVLSQIQDETMQWSGNPSPLYAFLRHSHTHTVEYYPAIWRNKARWTHYNMDRPQGWVKKGTELKHRVRYHLYILKRHTHIPVLQALREYHTNSKTKYIRPVAHGRRDMYWIWGIEIKGKEI